MPTQHRRLPLGCLPRWPHGGEVCNRVGLFFWLLGHRRTIGLDEQQQLFEFASRRTYPGNPPKPPATSTGVTSTRG